MRNVLCLLLLVAPIVAVAQIPFSWYPYMDFGTSPAFQQVSTGAAFQQTAWAKDLDTYQDGSSDPPGKQYQQINYSLSFHYEITSGTLQGGPNIGIQDGKITYTYTVVAHTVTAVTLYNDRFRVVDGGAF